MSAILSSQAGEFVPIFKVWPDQGSHPPVALTRPVCVIGRHEVGVNLPLRSPQVSKLHALVVRSGRRVYLHDLASTNGVQRNGAPVHEVGLSDEDVLRIGSYTLRCQSGFTNEATSSDDGGDAPSAPPVDAPLPPAELRGEGGSFPFPVGQQTVLIGRRIGCDVRLDDDSVSPVHAIVFELDGRRFLRDLDSPGGTFLEGRSIHQEPLEPGAEVTFGSVSLRYEILDATAEPVEAPAEIVPLEQPVVAPVDEQPVATLPPPEPQPQLTDVAEDVRLEDELGVEISIEDSQAPGNPDLGLYDSNLIEPDPPADPSFHGEVVDPAAEVFAAHPNASAEARPPAPALAEAPRAFIPIGDDVLIQPVVEASEPEQLRETVLRPTALDHLTPLGSHMNDAELSREEWSGHHSGAD